MIKSSAASRSVLASAGLISDLPEVSDRLKSSNVSVIKEMMYLGARESAKGKSIVSLGVGLPFYPAPPQIHEHVITQIGRKPEIDKYTLLIGLPKLRDRLAALSSGLLGFAVSSEEILVTPGSMAGLFYSMLTLLNPGDEIILPSPYFSSHAEQVAIAQGKTVPVAMIEDNKYGYRLDLDKIRKAITPRTKAILINNPHNPTGAVFPKEDLLKLAGIILDHKLYLITDEVYDYLVYDKLEYFNLASVKELWPRVIRCASFSKKFGMMGWRVGYLQTSRNLLLQILKVHDANIVCAPHISQEAAIAALDLKSEIVAHHVKLLDVNRGLIMERLDALGELFTYVKPRGTYYVFPKYKLDLSSIEMAKRLLYEAGVVTVPGIGFGPEGERHLRLSFGSPGKDIISAFDRIDKWYKTL